MNNTFTHLSKIMWIRNGQRLRLNRRLSQYTADKVARFQRAIAGHLLYAVAYTIENRKQNKLHKI
jgi:hypothetical protein